MRLLFCLVLVICMLLSVNGGVVKRADDLNTAVQTLQTLVEQQSAAISSLRATVNSQQDAISTLQSTVKTLSKPVAFTAMFSNDDDVNKGTSLGLHQTLIFDYVLTNAGNGYSTTTGIFTAPLAGYYAFSIVAQEPGNDSIDNLALSIVKNGIRVDELWAPNNPSTEGEQASTHSVLSLSAGDQVWIRQEGYGDGVRGGLWTVFTGYMVHAA